MKNLKKYSHLAIKSKSFLRYNNHTLKHGLISNILFLKELVNFFPLPFSLANDISHCKVTFNILYSDSKHEGKDSPHQTSDILQYKHLHLG